MFSPIRAAYLPRLAYIFVIFSVLSEAPALAFSSEEHRQVSNAALLVARHAAWQHHPSRKADIEAALQGLDGTSDISYGDLVMMVDHAIDPLQVLARDGTVKGLPTTYAEMPMQEILQLLDKHFRNLRADHNNRAHFQGQAVASFEHWHRVAVTTACEGNLLGGLLVNAFGDHLLQDSLASGHMATLRSGMHDLPALAMHDLFNLRGLRYSASRAGPTHERMNKLAVVTLQMLDATPSRELDAISSRETDAWRLLKCLKRSLETFAKGGWPIKAPFRGDGELSIRWRCQKRQEDQNAFDEAAGQTAFLVLAEALSLDDVLSSYLEHHSVNNYASYSYEPMRADGTGVRFARTELPIGGYDELRRKSKRGDYGSGVGIGIRGLAQSRDGEGWRPQLEVNYWPFLERPGHRTAQGEIRGKDWEYGVGVAATYARMESDARQEGARGSIILVTPSVDLAVSGDVGYSCYSSHGHNWWKPTAGVRILHGMGLIAFDVGVARSYNFTASDGISPGWMITAGVTLAGPPTYAPKWLFPGLRPWYERRYRRKGPLETECEGADGCE